MTATTDHCWIVNDRVYLTCTVTIDGQAQSFTTGTPYRDSDNNVRFWQDIVSELTEPVRCLVHAMMPVPSSQSGDVYTDMPSTFEI